MMKNHCKCGVVMRRACSFFVISILVFGCTGNKEYTNENYLQNIAVIEDASSRFKEYANFPFNQDWFVNRKSIELQYGKPNTFEESEGLTQWNEPSTYYIMRYGAMDIYGYKAKDREEVYRIDLYKNIWGSLKHGNIGSTKTEWINEFGESQEENSSERIVYGGGDLPSVVIYFDINGKAYKIIKWVSG